MKVIKTNTRDCKVIVNEDGTLGIFDLTNGGKPMPDAGAFIGGAGGIDAILRRCEEMSEDEYLADVAARKAAKETAKAKSTQERLGYEEKLKAKYKAAFANETTESNIDNIKLLLHYLNTMNWGSWELPKMSIGYKCAQHDCGGQLATTIVLDRPIRYDGRMVKAFKFGGGVHYLRNYTLLR